MLEAKKTTYVDLTEQLKILLIFSIAVLNSKRELNKDYLVNVHLVRGTKYRMIKRWLLITTELIEVSLHQDSNIEINDSNVDKNQIVKFTCWMKKTDVITVVMYESSIKLEKNHTWHPLYGYQFK